MARWALLGLLPLSASASVRVDISGVDAEVEQNVRLALDLVRLGAREHLSDPAVRRLYDRAGRQIRSAMRPFGFYQPEIESSLTRRGDGWRARLRIDPGEPMRIAAIDVRMDGAGRDEPALRQVAAQSPLRVGRRLRHQEYDRLRDDLQNAARLLGYFDARFDVRRLEVDPQRSEARVVLHMYTGERYRLGAVHMEQDVLDDDLLARIVEIREGDLFDAAALLRAQHRLTDSLFFASALVDAGAPDPHTRTVPITIEAVGVRRQRIRRSVGYATDTGPRVGLGVDWRRLNPAGHSAALDLRVGTIRSEMSGQYRVPIGDPIRESLLLRGGLVREDLADLESRRATAGVSRVTVSASDWHRTAFVDLLSEDTHIPGRPELNSRLVLPGLAAEKLVADDLLFPRHGYRLRGEVRASHRWLGADTDFLRLEIESVRVVSPAENWRLFARGALGIGLIDELSELPASQRFFAGGDTSVRGYGFNRLGPRDEQGNVIGGRHLVFGSLEVERTVWRRLALALFVDAGNAFDSFDTDLEASAGVGLNVRTPIGTVHLGWARAFTEDRDARIHLTIRPDL